MKDQTTTEQLHKTSEESNPLQLNSKVPKILTIAISALTLGIVADYFFYDQYLGASFTLYLWLITGTIFMLIRGFKMKHHRSLYWFIAPLVFFPAMITLRTSGVLQFLNIVTTFVLFAALLHTLFGKSLKQFQITDYIETIFLEPVRILEQAGDFIVDFLKLRTIFKNHQTISQVVKGVIMAVPILIFFLALFASADLIFRKYLLNIFQLNLGENFMARTITVVVIAFVLAGLFRYITHGLQAKNQSSSTENAVTPKPAVKTGIIETSIFLGLINALFLAFIAIQIAYLFGGTENISIEGFTYAEYARKGFFELITVAVVSFLIVFISEKSVQRKNENKHTLPFTILSTSLIVQVMVIMISAFKRLMLYESAYGFTELRLYSHIFIIYLAVIFLLLLYKIIIDKRENTFAHHSFIVTIVGIAALNLFNPDAFIARKNIEVFSTTDKLDLTYLSELSEDSIPEIVKAFELNNPYFNNILAHNLEKYNQDDYLEHVSNWQSWNLARSAALEAINQKRAQIEQFKLPQNSSPNLQINSEYLIRGM